MDGAGVKERDAVTVRVAVADMEPVPERLGDRVAVAVLRALRLPVRVRVAEALRDGVEL